MKKQLFFIYALFVMGLFLTFTSGCEKANGEKANSFTDPRDGNVYKTVSIGTQVWMAENLRYLPSVVGPGNDSETTPYYYVYGYDGEDVKAAKDSSNYSKYGVLYNWPAAISACPKGWHLPSDAEWQQLIDYLGGAKIAGGKLKEIGTKHWNSPNVGATNSSGFTALPAGFYFYGFGTLGVNGSWWSATVFSQGGPGTAGYWNVSIFDEAVYNSGLGKYYGYSVRCVKD